jgi:hypothetical protein
MDKAQPPAILFDNARLADGGLGRFAVAEGRFASIEPAGRLVAQNGKVLAV